MVRPSGLTRNCLVNAEESGINSSNVDEIRKSSTNPRIKRILGAEGYQCKFISFDNAWCSNTIKHLGNYGDIHDRNPGPNAVITIDRGLNRLD